MNLFPSRIYVGLRKKSQNEGARGMATLKDISVRLKSVKNIQKITQSMKMGSDLFEDVMKPKFGNIDDEGGDKTNLKLAIGSESTQVVKVSAAKFSRAERELKQCKSLGEGIQKFYKHAEVGVVTDGKPSDEKETQPKKQLFVAVTSDRGLCGSVHVSIAKAIRNALKQPSENIKIVCIGDKSRTLLQRVFGPSFLFVCQEVGRLPPTFRDASRIANEILRSEFEYDEGKILFNRFRSVVSNVTEELSFYNTEIVSKAPKVDVYEEATEDTLLSFIEFSLATMIFYAMKEGACSEQSSRMTAMDNASKNAGDMINKLTLTFNRTRQAVITRELIEIISGASAL